VDNVGGCQNPLDDQAREVRKQNETSAKDTLLALTISKGPAPEWFTGSAPALTGFPAPFVCQSHQNIRPARLRQVSVARS
jgi:hypothetical protein